MSKHFALNVVLFTVAMAVNLACVLSFFDVLA